MANPQNDYLSLEGLVTPETRPWGGESNYLAPGEHAFEVVEAEKDQSANDNPVIRFTFKVFEGDLAGQTIKKSYALTQKAIGRLVCLLQAIGVKTDSKGGFSISSTVGRRFRATVTEEMREGDPNPMTGEKTFKRSSNLMSERAWVAGGAAKDGKAPSTSQARA